MKLSLNLRAILKNILDRIPMALVMFVMLLGAFLGFGGTSRMIISIIILIITFLIAVQCAIFTTMRGV